MLNKEKYKQLCETEGAGIPLFLQYWWMEAVGEGKQWDVLLAERDGEIVAALPYLYGSKLGMHYIVPPQLTMWSGPWLRDKNDMDSVRKMFSELSRLHLSLHIQCFNVDISLILKEEGYDTKERHTYRFEQIKSLDEMMANAAPLRRRDYKKLCDELHLKPIQPSDFASMHLEYWHRRGTKDLIRKEILTHLCQRATERSQALLMGAFDKNEHMQASIFIPYDSKCAYLLMSAIAKNAPRNTMSYLIWSMIDMLRPLTKAFDFEGSSEHGVEQFYKSFGPTKTTFLEATKKNWIMKLVLTLRTL